MHGTFLDSARFKIFEKISVEVGEIRLGVVFLKMNKNGAFAC